MATDPEGYVKVWRRLLKHPLWKSSNSTAKVLFIHILLTVNWKPGKWLYESTVVDIGPGERIGSSKKLAAELGLSRQEFRHAVEILQNLEIVARDATRDKGKRYTRLTLMNWDRWQGVDGDDGKPQQPENQPHSNQTATRLQPDCNQTATTIKEGKKLRREEQSTSTPVSSGKPPEETAAGFALQPTDGNGSKPKRPKKIKPSVRPMAPEIYEDWKTLLRTHPKQKYGAGIARNLFIDRVHTKAQSGWLVSALQAEVASGEKYWGRFDDWLLDRLESMDASQSPEEAAVHMDAESADYEARIERERKESYEETARWRAENPDDTPSIFAGVSR